MEQQPSVGNYSIIWQRNSPRWLTARDTQFRTYWWIEESSKWRRRGHWFPENCSGFISHGVVKIYTKPGWPPPHPPRHSSCTSASIVLCAFLPLSLSVLATARSFWFRSFKGKILYCVLPAISSGNAQTLAPIVCLCWDILLTLNEGARAMRDNLEIVKKQFNSATEKSVRATRQQ